MGVDHGGANIGVAEEFLDGADVVAIFEQVCCKRMAEGVGGSTFINAGEADGSFDFPLDVGFFHVMAHYFFCDGIRRTPV